VVEESFHVDGDLLGEQELLLVELFRHRILERLVKELSENDDEGEYDQEEEYDAGWSKKPVFLEGPEQAWHGLLYFQNMSDVKGLDGKLACGLDDDGQENILSLLLSQ